MFTPDYELKNAIEAQKAAGTDKSSGSGYQHDKLSGT
jgi:hypothetical protein